jgi:WD40 repeat protein
MSSGTPSEETTVAGIHVHEARDVTLRAGGDIVAGNKTTIRNYYGPQPQDITKAPYKFLSYYDIGDRDIFFGRDAVIEELAGEIPRHKVLIINGQSGSGKTSLLNAGLIPRLAENGYLYVYFRDYTNPLEQLREYFRDHPDFALPGAEKLSLLQILRAIRRQQESPVVVIFDQFERFLVNVAAQPRREFLQQLRECLESDLTADELNLVISLRDDFYGKLLLEAEAIIPTFDTASHHHNLRTLNRDEARQAIIQPLKNIPNIGFDSKFVDDVLLPHLMGASETDGQSVQPETKIEPPHLQIVCNQLYEAARDRYRQQLADGEPIRIGFDLYHALGETEGMLRDYLDDVVRRITNGDPKHIAIVRSTLKLMIETIGTRKFETLTDISANLPDVPQSEIERIVGRLQEARVVEPKQLGSTTAYSLSHEIMVAKVESWFDEREMLRRRAQETLERGLAEWNSTNALLNETQVHNIRRWLPDNLLKNAERLLVESERQIQEQKQQAQEQREKLDVARKRTKAARRIAAVVAAILIPLSVGFGIWGTINATTARNKEKEAIKAQEDLTKTVGELDKQVRNQRIASFTTLASQARSQVEDYPQRAVLLALEAARRMQQIEDAPQNYVESVLRVALSNIGGHGIGAHFEFPNEVDISSDGRWLATTGIDGTAILWDLRSGDPITNHHVLRGHSAQVTCLTFGPDGRWLITGSQDNSIRRWNLTATPPDPKSIVLAELPERKERSGRRPTEKSVYAWSLKGTDRLIERILFVGGGKWLAVDHDDGWSLLRLTDDQVGEPIRIEGYSLPISSDGRWLVRAPQEEVGTTTGKRSITKSLLLYDLTKPAPLQNPIELSLPKGSFVQSPGFSPKSEWLLATGIFDGRSGCWLWNMANINSDTTPIVLEHKRLETFGQHFSPNDDWLITEDKSQGVRLWNLRQSNPSTMPQYLGPTPADSFTDQKSLPDAVTAIEFGLDQKLVLHRRHSKLVEYWNLGNAPSSIERNFDIGDDAFRRIYIDATKIVLAGEGDAIVCNLADRPEAKLVTRLERTPDSPPIDPIQAQSGWIVNDKLIVHYDGDFNYEVWLWRLGDDGSASAPMILKGHDYEVFSATISPDAHWMVTLDKNGTGRLWNLDSESQARYPTTIVGKHGIDLSPTGDWLFVGSDKGDLIYDLRNAEPTSVAVDARQKIIALSENGRWLVTYSSQSDDTIVRNLPDDRVCRRVKLLRLQEIVKDNTFLGQFSALGTSPSELVSGDGNWLIVRRDEKHILLWNLEADSDPIPPVELPVESGQLMFSPDGAWLISGPFYSGDAVVQMWRLNVITSSSRPFEIPKYFDYSSIGCSPDSRWLALQGKDMNLRLCALREGNPTAAPLRLKGKFEDRLTELRYSPDSRWLIAKGLNDDTARIWDLSTINDAQAPVELSENGADRFVFSPDRRWLASLHSDIGGLGGRIVGPGGNSRIYQFIQRGIIPQGIKIDRPGYYAASACFTSDGSRVFVIDSNGKSYFLDLKSFDADLRYFEFPGLQTAQHPTAASINSRWYVVRYGESAFRTGEGTHQRVALHRINIGEIISHTVLLADTVGRNLSLPEWREFFPGQEYQKTFAELPSGDGVNDF